MQVLHKLPLKLPVGGKMGTLAARKDGFREI